MLHQPLLYLSLYLKRYRLDYYDALMAVRHEGDWESWLTFFVRGVAVTAEQASETARSIVTMRETQREAILSGGSSTNALRLLDYLYERPMVDVTLVSRELAVSFATANKIIEQLDQLGLVREITGRKRDRIFRFQPYLDLFQDGEDSPDAAHLDQTTPVRDPA